MHEHFHLETGTCEDNPGRKWYAFGSRQHNGTLLVVNGYLREMVRRQAGVVRFDDPIIEMDEDDEPVMLRQYYRVP